MQINLKRNKIRFFESKMNNLAPWMHSFKFGENIYTGYFKYDDIKESLTFVNNKSSTKEISILKNCYHKKNHSIDKDFFFKVLDELKISTNEKRKMNIIDISSATGKKSLWSVDYGFKKVIASEIRKNQTEQLKLILDCASNKRYLESITPFNDITSADSNTFNKKYKKFGKIDLVLSFGLLYHLSNPIQHLKNIYNMTSKYAIIYTHTHSNPFASNLWELTTEDKKWITKATQSVSLKPHYYGLIEQLKKSGFRKVKIAYPEIFSKNFNRFNKFDKLTKLQVIFFQNLSRFGINLNLMKNYNFNYFKNTNLNPNYFAYICFK